MKRKGISASTYQMGMVYGGLLVAMFNPFAGAATAAAIYPLYKARKKLEDADRQAQREEDRAEFKAKFYRRQRFDSYEAYLASPEWKSKRDAVVRRAKGRCEAPECTSGLDEVHHVRYPRVWGNEPIDWLIGLCEFHHRAAHHPDRHYVKR